jgi:hypothetical protein
MGNGKSWRLKIRLSRVPKLINQRIEALSEYLKRSVDY